MKADKILEDMAKTFRERGKVYGDNYIRFGNMLHALFPNGLTINTPEDWVKFGFFFNIMQKASRFTTKNAMTHADSVHDMGVYSAMLEAWLQGQK